MSSQFTAKICFAFMFAAFIATGSNTANSHHFLNKSWHCHQYPIYKNGIKVGSRKVCHGYTLTKPQLPEGSERKDLRSIPIKKR